MTGFEKEILEHVRQHPGCGRGTFDEICYRDAAEEADRMVVCGKLYRGYTGTVPVYYLPGMHTPHHLREPETQEGIILLAAGLHRDGTIHIYVKEKDSGLSVGLLEDGMLIVKIDESMRTMVAGKA